jgi:hypothetical protein
MTITCTDVASATAAFVAAPLDPAALMATAEDLAAAAEHAAVVRFLHRLARETGCWEIDGALGAIERGEHRA